MESNIINYPNDTVRAISEFLFVETPFDKLGCCDLVIVMGSDLIDGTMYEVKKLLDCGVIKSEGKIVLSGATGLLNAGKEKECIRMYRSGVEKYGISPELLVMEDQATNAYQNLAFSKKLIEEDKDAFPDRKNISSFARILIIGKAFMMRRAEMCARRLSYPMEKLAFYGTVDREGKNIGKDCWWLSESAMFRVYGEIERIGKYAAGGDLTVY